MVGDRWMVNGGWMVVGGWWMVEPAQAEVEALQWRST